MSNSSLVTYKNITKNRTSPRNHMIDTITIHIIVGQWTAKECCDYFATTDRRCSSNYVVGKDGSIGLSVEEKDASWCSSSSANDNRAITIEVASDTTHPYAVNDVAYNALIDLVADICKRNGIKKLLWSTEKDDRVNHRNGCNMTVHRDFANKSCPGEYLYERHGDIAKKVNEKLNEKFFTIAARPEKIWNFLLEWLGNEYGVAGLMGNLYVESGLYAYRLQGDFIRGYEASMEYTRKVDSGEISEHDFVYNAPNGGGYGLAQWTFWSRKQAYKRFADSKNASIGSLDIALEFLKLEIERDYSSLLKILKNAKSVREASDAVLTKYEKPADQGEAQQKKRADYGQKYYDQFSSPIYRVQVGAYSKKENAEKQLVKIQKAGFDAFVAHVDGMYKVQVGAFSKKENADAMLAKVKKAGFDAFITTKSNTTASTNTKSVDELAKEVIAGKWGVGQARKDALTKAGYDYNIIQRRVNELLA
ncbi:MAG: N-acetylmuramoyl-L-alanine amidase [Lachnospiraceae bacterium]|nr:N-acetylmuramoyl-L-alanine amidase [Lachnospiraceae bacterium]